ncbi:hypothetical protein Agub_g5222 [Astrephomene gubernaculifera]|uniref:Guanylate cyclase domain-containing protein n=1 Tax=Astrephomene gubernaculifera TaxID=47775 RepID=A0AAD3HKE7_9CHLO|nr:hypothetical protein Agub_g5222 [Astrephomene gubernaculifera]
MSKLLLVFGLLLALALSALANPTDVCIRAVFPRLITECELLPKNSLHTGSNSSGINLRNAVQDIVACFSDLNQSLSILAPNVSSTSFARAQIGYLQQQRQQATNATPAHVDFTLTGMATWGRTLAQIGGVAPGFVGLAANATVDETYDAWLVDPIALADLYDSGLTLDLSHLVLDDSYREQIQWVGIHQLLRASVVVAEGSVAALPFGGLVYQMYYRRDVLAAHGLDPPATWDEFLAAAQRVNGTDMNEDGQPDYGVCLQRARYCWNSFSLVSIWSSFIQSEGTQQGAFFDPATMQPLVNNSAMREALRIYRALQDYGPPDEVSAPCQVFNEHFVRGRCALTLSWGYQFKANTFLPYSYVRDRASVALLPGSTRVLNRTSGQLQPCSSTLVCPYAQETPAAGSTSSSSSSNGSSSSSSTPAATTTTRLVNRAPYLALASVSVAVSTRSSAQQQTHLLDMFAYLSSRNVSWDLVTSSTTELGPYRYEHFDTANLDQWVRRGYPGAAVREFLSVMKAQLDSPNVLLEVRTLDAYAYRHLLDTFATQLSEAASGASGGSSSGTGDPSAAVDRQVQAALQGLAEALNEVYVGGGGGSINATRAAARRRYYLYSIGLTSESDWMPPQLDDGSSTASSSSSSRLRTVVPLAVVVPVLVVLFVTAGAAAVWFNAVREKRREEAQAPKGPPGLGEDTTLMVSDVEGSTALWEVIKPEVMDVVFNLHHDCMRRTAVRFGGYESQTEGDSFIIAFHCADSAVQFALAVQQALLDEPWPRELLAHEKCRPVWLVRTGAEVPLDVPLEPTAVAPPPPPPLPVQRANGNGFEHSGGRLAVPHGTVSCDGSPGAATPSGSRLDLRRLVAWRGNSRWRVNSVADSLGDGGQTRRQSGAGDLGPAAGGQDVSVSGGVAAFADDRSAHGSVHEEVIAPVFSTTGMTIGALPVRYSSVADALRAMWREVNVSAPDPWAHNGGGMGLGRWQNVKTALRTSMSSRISVATAAAALASAMPAAAADAPPSFVRSRSLPARTQDARGRLGTTSPRLTSVGHGLLGGDGAAAAAAVSDVEDDAAQRCFSDNGHGHAVEEEAPPQLPLPGASRFCSTSSTAAAAMQTQITQERGSGGSLAASNAAAAFASAHPRSLGRRLAATVTGLGMARSASGRTDPSGFAMSQTATTLQTSRFTPSTPPLRASLKHLLLRSTQQQSHHPRPMSQPQPHVAPQSQTTTPHQGPPQYHLRHTSGGHLAPPFGLEHAEERAAAPPEQCTLVRRGLMVRIGLHSGVRHMTDLQYSEVAARWKYSGEILAAAKAVSDAANGGDVFISAACLSRLGHDFLSKRCRLLYLGRHVLRGGDPAAAAAAAAASHDPPQPAPGAVAELYAVYSPKLLPRLGLYRPPRTAQSLGMSALEAPLGRVAYGVVMCHNLAEMALHHESIPASVVSEAKTALGSITADQLLACHGVMAAPSPHCGVGAVAGAFRNPYHAVLWALQSQEDLLRHPWSQEMLSQEQFEAIVVPEAAADALVSPNTAPTLRRGGPWGQELAEEQLRGAPGVPPPPYSGGGAGGGGSRGTGDGDANSTATDPGGASAVPPPLPAWAAVTQAQTRSERSLLSCEDGVTGAAGAGATAAPTQAAGLMVSDPSSICGSNSVRGLSSLPSWTRSSAPGGAATVAAARLGPPRSATTTAVVACSASIASQTGAAGLAAAAAPSTGSSYNPVAATMPRCESTIEICTTDGERESIPARPTPSGLSGWSSSVMAAAGTSIYGPNPSPTSPPQPSHPPPPPPPQLQAHASCGAVAQQQWPVSDDSNPKCPPALPPAQAAQGSVTVTGMGPASAAVPVTGEVVLFRGPRIKGVITFGALKASLDPLTGRVRYEGKAVSQAVKMMSYAAIGMVVASVEAVEAGHVEDSEAEGTPGGGGGGGGRAAGTVPSGCTPRQVSTATEPPDDKQRQCSMTLRLPAPVRPASPPLPPQLTISRTDSFLNDPEGPSAAMAAAAKAAAAALLNLAPSGGSFVQGGSASSSRRSIPLDSLSRRDSLAQLAAALGAPNGAGLANSGPLSRRRSPARAHRKKRTSDATDAADAPSGPLIMAADGAGGSRFPSGYSTPASGPSYSYTHNPLYGTGAGSGAASPLRPDSRAHSRTAVRALSNLNPDSRQGSRTMMHRTSGLSVPAGPAQYQPPLPPAQLQQLLRPLAAARRRRASKVTRGPSAHAHMERDASGTNGVCSTPTSPVAAAAAPGEHHARAAGALPEGSPLWVGSPPSGAVDAFLRTSHGPPLATSRRSRRSHGSDASSISDAPRDPSTRALRSAAAATAVATADPAKEGSIGSSGDCGSPPLTPRRLPVGLEVAPLRRRRRASRRLHAHPAAAAAPLPLASSPRSQGLRLGPEPQPPSDSLTGSGAETGHERHVRPPVPRPSGQVVAATLEETVTAAQPAAEAESAAIDACDCSFPTSLPMPPAPAIPPQQQQQLRSEAAARVSGSGGGCDSGGSLGRANGEEPAPEPRGRRSQDLPQGALLPTVGEDCSLNHTLGAIARGRTSSLRRSSALGSAGKRCSSLRRGDAPTGVPLLIAVGRSSSLRVSDSSSPFPLVSSAPLDALRQQQQQQLPSPILMLQQRDSGRVFPCTGHTTTSGLRSAAVLPSVQVLSLEHGSGPHIHSAHHHQQHPLHHHHHLLHHLHYNGSNTHSAGGDAGQGSSLGGTTGGGASGVCSSSAVVLRCASIEPEHHYSSSGLPAAAAAGPAPQTPTHGSAPQVPWPGSSSSRSPMAPPQQRSEFAAAAALASPSCQRPSPGHWAQWPAATTSASFLNAGARIGSGCGMNGAALTTAPAAINIANASSAFGSNGGAGGGVGAAVCLEAGAPPTVALRKTLDVGLDQVVMLPVALKKRGSSQPLVVYLCRFASSARMCEMQQRLVTMGHGDTTAAAAAAVTAAAAAAATIASGNASLTTAAATEASFAAVASSMTMEATPAGIVSPLPYNKLSDGPGTSGLAPAPAVAAAAGTSGGAAAGSHMLEKLDWKHVAGLFSGTVRHASHDSAAAAAAGSHPQPPGAAAHLLPLHVPGQAVRRASLTGFIGGRGAHDMLSRRSMNLTSRAGCCDNNMTHAQLASPSVIPHLGPLPPLGGNVVSGGSVAISARSASRGAGLTGGGGGGGSFMRRLRRASVDITSPKRRQGLVVSALGHALYGGVALPQGEVRTMNVKRVQRATCVSGPAQHLLAALPPPQQAAAAAAAAAAANASTAGSTAGSTATHAAAASATLPYINSLYSTGHHTTYGVGTHGPTPSMPLPRQPLPSAPPTHGYAATTGSAGFARPSTAGASLLQSVMRHLGPHPVMVSNPLADRSAVSCEDGDGCGTNGITLTQRAVSASQAEAAVVAAVVAAAGGSNGSYEESTGAAAAAAAAAAAPTSYENPSATPSITLSVIAGGGGGGGGGGNTAAAAPAFGPGVFLHSTSTSSQQLIIVGAANNSNGGQEGAAGGGSGSIGSLWEFSGLQAAFRATGGGRTTPQRSRLMTPTEEGHETDGEGGCE